MPSVPSGLAIVGRVRRAHGVRGALVVETMTDAPEATFASGRRVFAGTTSGDLWRDPETREPLELTVTGSRPFKGGLLVSVSAILDRTEAERWRSRYLLAPFSELEPPAEGEVYLHELDGMRVLDLAGAALGEVRAWYQLPNGILLDVHTARGDVSLPFNDRFVRSLDRATRTITVEIPEELFDGGPDDADPGDAGPGDGKRGGLKRGSPKRSDP